MPTTGFRTHINRFLLLFGISSRKHIGSKDRALTIHDFVKNGNIYRFDGFWVFKLVTYGELTPEKQASFGSESLEEPDGPLHLPTPEELQQDHLIRKHDFETSVEWERLRVYLMAEKEKGLKITKIVALGLGRCQHASQSLEKEAACLKVLMTFLSEFSSAPEIVSCLLAFNL